MKDSITLTRIQLLHPVIREEVMDIYVNEIVPALSSSTYCRFAYTLRTFQEQDELYAMGRTKMYDQNGKRLGVVTQAKGGQSLHCYGLALDIVLINGRSAYWDIYRDFDDDSIPDWVEIARIFESHDWEWGNSWGDSPHFQRTFGLSWEELLERYNQKLFLPGTTYVNI